QTATGFTVSSSRSYKSGIERYTIAPDLLDRMQPVTFEYRTMPGRRHIGLIAEDMQPLVPEAVFIGAGGSNSGIDYMQLVPVLIAELQQLRRRVAALEARSA